MTTAESPQSTASSEPAPGPIDFVVVEFPAGPTPRTSWWSCCALPRWASSACSTWNCWSPTTPGRPGVDLAAPDAPAGLSVLAGAQSGLFDDEDIAEAASILDPGVFALLIAYENTWASPFVSAAHGAGGRVVASERIPAQAILDTLDALDG
ncbi:MAG: DUF6325 family protein [Microthrixaceae bacterium]